MRYMLIGMTDFKDGLKDLMADVQDRGKISVIEMLLTHLNSKYQSDKMEATQGFYRDAEHIKTETDNWQTDQMTKRNENKHDA